MYAAGKIPGGFIKRESRAVGGSPSGDAPHRPPIRPLFEGYKQEVQIVLTVL